MFMRSRDGTPKRHGIDYKSSVIGTRFLCQQTVAVGDFQKSFGVFYMTHSDQIRQHFATLMKLSTTNFLIASLSRPNESCGFHCVLPANP
jgi:hypothetical protein